MSGLFALLYADNTVKSLLGTTPMRVYGWSAAPQNSTAPYVTYAINGIPQNQMDKAPDVDLESAQLDIWAATQDSADAVFAAIRNALETSGYMTAFSTVEFDTETKLYHSRMEFDFFTAR